MGCGMNGKLIGGFFLIRSGGSHDFLEKYVLFVDYKKKTLQVGKWSTAPQDKYGVRDGVNEASGPPPLGDDFVMPSLEQMLEALEKMDMNDDDKEGLRKLLLERSQMSDDMMSDFFKPAFDILPSDNPLMQYVLLFAFILVLIVFVFFGYKLYRSLTEKERKRDEKKKQKQMKKKK